MHRQTNSFFEKTVSGFAQIRPEERQVLGLSWLYVLVLFMAYYVLRPIRDELGASGGVDNLPWLFTATLAAMLVLTPLYGTLVKRFERTRFIAYAYRFFMANLLIFSALMAWGAEAVLAWTGRAFFVWVSVFNLFVVSVFWSLMSDVFSTGQSKRLFGFLASGATLGGLLGAGLLALFADEVNHHFWLVLAVVFLEIAVQSAKAVSRQTQTPSLQNPKTPSEQPKDGLPDAIGGGIWAGLTHTLKSPYLLGISAFILLYTVTSTLLYFQQAEIVNAYFSDRGERTAFFARIDVWVNVLTLIFQCFIAGRLMGRLGVSLVLAVLPFISMAGFATLALMPTVAVFVVLQVGRRVANFAFAKPAREVLFTRLNREDRYKAKNFIDTAVYRTGDQIGSWGYAGLSALGLGISAVSWLAVPLCLAWLAVALWLGKRAGV